MADAPTYATFTANGGKLTEAQFDAALSRAMSTVNAAIWPNVVTEVTQAAYERAVCAVVPLIDSPAVTAERVGNVSLQYADVPTIATAIRAELTGTGLLYRGL